MSFQNIDKETNKIEYTLRSVWGDKFIDKYINWCFDFSCVEANFLQLKDSCISDLEYKVSFNKLCRFRRTSNLGNLFNLTKSIKEQTGVDYKDLKDYTNIRLNLNFEQQIRDLYYPVKEK